MTKAKYGLSHLEKLANEIDVIFKPYLVNLEYVGGEFLTVELNTREEPVNFQAFNSLVLEHRCKIDHIAAREDYTGDLVAFFIKQEGA